MKTENFTILKANQRNSYSGIISLTFGLLFFLITLSSIAQDECAVEKSHGQGYTTAITSVTDIGSGNYTITLLVSHDGCPGPECKSLSHYSVEAAPGTYSNVTVVPVSGSFSYSSISMGPDLGSDPFQGFKINGTSGIGGGLAASFKITYTLSGGFQNQQTLAKAGPGFMIVSFSIADFQEVLDCDDTNIFPYYAPPEGGKLENSLIGPELNSLYFTYLNTGLAVSDNIFQIDGSNVLIRVFALPGQLGNLLTILTSPSYGLSDEVEIVELNAIIGWFPISNLLMINSLDTDVNYARPEYPPQSNAGLVTTQGDIAMRSNIARAAFNLMGEGVKVGVLSDSYNKKFGNPANDDVLKGDLPGVGIDPDGNLVPNPVNPVNVHVLKDYPYTASDEGRAMLQIIHDIVPKSELAFRTGFISAIDFADGIVELKNAGCDIIVDDITYITEPFFRDGIVAQAVNSVVDEGVVYFSAAGNFGTNSYENYFYGGAPPSGLSGAAHNFAGNNGYDIFQSISMEQGNYLIVLQWDDGSDFGSTTTDLDIYLTNNNGNTLFGFNRVNTGGDPIEVLPFSVGEGGAQANLVILKSAGAEDVRFKYIVFRGQLTMDEYANVGNSTIVGQANAEGAIAVGAVLYTNTPEYGVNPPTIASFSSRGGTVINGVDRMKPEITAPNGVNTTVDLGGFNLEGDPFPNFFGTSAAAPHAAAVAALLQEAANKFYDNALSPADVRSILTSTAIDMGTPGYEPASGYGFIQADAALLTMANPSPVISGLVYDTTLVPGIDSIQIIITGQFLTEGSQVYFNGEPVESETIVYDGSTAISIIPPFFELYPMIQVYNPPNALTNGTDGGLSNPLYFTTKETLLVTIDDKSKMYGEALPLFTATYSVENIDGSLSLADAGLTAEEIARVLSVPFEALNVSPLSNSGLWAISASQSDPLNPASGIPATDPIDLALLDKFDFLFVNGLLNIERLELLIKPQDAVFTYGEPVENIQFDYVYNDDPDNPLTIPPEVNTQILSLLQAGHATALVNGKSTSFLGSQATALVNKSFMVSATALVNSIGLIEIEFDDPDIIFDSAALVNGLATALVNGKATALVNASALVAGQATALVNGQATALVNAASLGYATALVNTTTFNATSNNESIILLTDEDIYILAGLAQGEITLISMNLIESSNAGTYWIVPGTFVTNNFNVTYEPGQITFLPAIAALSFVEESLIQTYNGDPILPVVITDPEGLTVELTYDGLTEAPVNTGTYEVIATVVDPNYIGADTAMLTIVPAVAAISFVEESLTQTYNGSPISPIVVTDPDGLTVELTYDGLTDAPVNTGTYEVIATVFDPNYIGADTATLTIVPIQISIAADDLEKNYGEQDPSLTYVITAGELIGDDELSGELMREPGEDISTYSILLGSLNGGLNYYISFTPGVFTIYKAQLTVSIETTFIFKGQPLPEFTFTFDGFAFDDDQSVLTSLGYTMNPSYNGAAGIYTLTPYASAVNYDIIPVDGYFYVNPFGPGTKHIVPKLLCVDVNPTITGFSHVAWFGYTNNNSTVVYIPKGADNIIASSGLFDASEQPEIFLPGSHSFAVPFDGTSLMWTVASYNHRGHKTSAGASASSNSKKCTKSAGVDEEEPEIQLAGIQVFPNPATDRVYVVTGDERTSRSDIRLFDLFGNQMPVEMKGNSGDLLEINLSGLAPGVYVIRISLSGNVEAIRIVKH